MLLQKKRTELFLCKSAPKIIMQRDAHSRRRLFCAARRYVKQMSYNFGQFAYSRAFLLPAAAAHILTCQITDRRQAALALLLL